jgi:hypothetical protein
MGFEVVQVELSKEMCESFIVSVYGIVHELQRTRCSHFVFCSFCIGKSSLNYILITVLKEEKGRGREGRGEEKGEK